MSTEDQFPVIDFGSYDNDPEIVASSIFDAASRWGFLVLKNHGIPSKDVDSMFETSRAFFQQPDNIKSEKWMNTKQQGYDYKHSTVGVTEGMCFGSVAGSNIDCENIPSWWTVEKRQQAENFRIKCNELARKLLTSFARSMGLPLSYFDSAHDSANEPGNVLRLIRYPPIAAAQAEGLARLGEHTDWGTLTLLFVKSAGLEVLTPKNDSWVPAPVIKDTVIINIGDGLSLWSGQTLKSTKHRLSWESLPFDQTRHSIAYFVNANARAKLEIFTRDPETNTFAPPKQGLNATFGDYQQVRMRLIHEKFDSDGTEEELKLDPRLLQTVRNLGVAHGTGVNFEGREPVVGTA